MDFVSERADLLTLNQLRLQIVEALGPEHTPSRSQLFRLVQRVRKAAAVAYRTESGRQ